MQNETSQFERLTGTRMTNHQWLGLCRCGQSHTDPAEVAQLNGANPATGRELERSLYVRNFASSANYWESRVRRWDERIPTLEGNEEATRIALAARANARRWAVNDTLAALGSNLHLPEDE